MTEAVLAVLFEFVLVPSPIVGPTTGVVVPVVFEPMTGGF